MPFTIPTLNALLNAIHGKADYPEPATLYIGLSTTPPNTAGGNVTEPVGNNYSRTAVPASSFGMASNGSITNTQPIPFPTASGPWGTVVAAPVWDVQTGGTPLFYAAIPSQSIVANVTPTLAAGAATSTLT